MIYEVQLIPQSTDMSCWAACIAMILTWRDGVQYDPQKIAQNPGGLNYMPQFANGGPGLDPSDHYILETNGLVTEIPKCYSTTNITAKLMQFGPLWFASTVPAGPHIRVIRGISGEQLYINDPSPVGTGSQYQAAFADVFGAMETLGSSELAMAAPVYLAHLP